MRNFRGRLTRIKTLIGANLPDGPDIYGSEGVTKAMLMTTIDSIYALSTEIEAHEDSAQFEVVMLKRYEERIHDSLKAFLEGLPGTPKKDKLEDFLEKLSKLYERTKTVYFIVNQNGLRSDTEIANLRAQIASMTEQKNQYEALLKELTDRCSAVTTRSGEIETALTAATNTIGEQSKKSGEDTEAIQTALNAIMEWHKSISEVYDKMEGWDGDIKLTLDAANSNKLLLAELLSQLKLGIDSLNNATAVSDALTEVTKETHQEITEIETEIQDTLGDANRVGMAASFQTQMNTMQKAQTNWQWIFIATIAVFLAVSAGIVYFHLSGDKVDWRSAISRLPLLTPVIWLAWFAARQYSLANRVREDYAFKYSSAMAYEGYKKAVREAAPELEKTLVQVAVGNMAENPVRLYDPKHHDHASPVEGMVDKLLGRVRGAKAQVDKTGASASVDVGSKE